jgi:pimeloyl-ACP methyl ester carboxylesterase
VPFRTRDSAGMTYPNRRTLASTQAPKSGRILGAHRQGGEASGQSRVANRKDRSLPAGQRRAGAQTRMFGPAGNLLLRAQTLRVAGQRRWRRWLWRICARARDPGRRGHGLLVRYNAVTRKPMAVPAALTYVRTGDLSTHFRQWGTSGDSDCARPRFVESRRHLAVHAARLAAAGHRVYALDLDGWATASGSPLHRGASDHPAAGLHCRRRLHRPVLVGHSSGAAIVAMAALRRPSAVGAVMFTRRRRAEHRRRCEFFAHRFLSTTTAPRSCAFCCDPTLSSAAFTARPARFLPPLDAHGIDQWRRPLQSPVPKRRCGQWPSRASPVSRRRPSPGWRRRTCPRRWSSAQTTPYLTRARLHHGRTYWSAASDPDPRSPSLTRSTALRPWLLRAGAGTASPAELTRPTGTSGHHTPARRRKPHGGAVRAS